MCKLGDRNRMGLSIVDFEAGRDSKGRMTGYYLPSRDGGGGYAIACINERFHPGKASALRSLIMAGKYDQAEREAAEYIMQYTNSVEAWLQGRASGAEFYLRDTYFNTGPGGAVKILQAAVGAQVDGIVGSRTKETVVRILLAEGERGLLKRVHETRWAYMNGKSQHLGHSQFWSGWKNRMNKALAFAEKF